jgi:hypothetical protein
MARVLIVGCGCRGTSLAGRLVAGGIEARGTTRDEARLPLIEAAGAQAALTDPARLATLTPHLDGVSAVAWLLGSAKGSPEEVASLHGPRLASLLETMVDTHARGLVYEAAGSVERALLERGAATAREASDTYRMPIEVVTADPGDHRAWLEACAGAVRAVLSA